MASTLLQMRDPNGMPQLSTELVDIIKLFTGEGSWRDGKYINKIPTSDRRYQILHKRPRIKQVHNATIRRENERKKGSAWFKINGNYMVINSGYRYIWNNGSYYEGFLTEIYYKNTETLHFIQ